MNEVVSINTYINEFREAFESGLESIVKAGQIYVKAIDENPRYADKFRESFADSIPTSAWSGFEAVGRKWMHPKLLMGGMASGKKSRAIKRLPYSTQERVFNRERFDLLLPSGDTLQVDMMEATPEQVEQLCDGSTIRGLSAQKAYIESKAATPKSDPVELMPYTITNGKVCFRRGVSLTRQELKRVLQEM